MEEAERARLKSELRRLHEKKNVQTRNVNFHLLFLIVLLLIAIVGATFYFFWKYNNTVSESKGFSQAKSVIESDLSTCRITLDKSIEQMDELLEDFNISSSSMASLRGLYTNVSNLKEKLATDLSNTQTSLSTCQTDLVSSRDELNDAIAELNTFTTQYNQKVLELQAVKKDNEALKGNVTALKNSVKSLEITLARVQEDLRDLQDCVDANANCTACQ